jgi:mannitol/fructose-specific phosphotransferase system IIA component (Ntr-type)
MIKDYLNRDTVAIHQRAIDKYEAIRLVGALAVNAKMAQQDYVEEMIASLDALGPYMVLSPGIAFAHARPGDNVLRDFVTMIVLDTPVPFGHPKNDPVKVLFAIGARDQKHHLSCMRVISKLISREGFVSEISSIEELEDILKYINSAEEG